MADVITQLQERLDQLNTQLYASLRYISTHHSTSPLPPPSTTTTFSNAPQQQEQQQQNNHISPSSTSFPPAAAVAAAPPSPALPNGQTAAPAAPAAAAQQPPPPVAGPTATATTTTTALEQQQQQQPQEQSQQQQQQQQDAQPSFKITDLDPEQRPDSPATFAAAQRELAHDLVIKTRQIEELIHGIVGVERGREEQEGRISVLEEDLRGAIGERERVEREKGEWVGRMEGLICSVRR